MKYPKPQEWEQLVEEYRKSGLQQKEFVAKHDVSLNRVRYWLYRGSKGLQIKSESSPKFLPVQVVASPALKARVQPAIIEAAVRGIVLRFTAGTDPRYLAELLAALS